MKKKAKSDSDNASLQTSRDLQTRILKVIDQDIAYIEAVAAQEKLPFNLSNDIVKYSAAIQSIIKELSILEEEEKEALKKMTDDELMKLAKEAIREHDSAQRNHHS